MFYIILAFIGVFIIFIAMIMNYAAAYRTNNYVVTEIEQSEGRIEYETLVNNLKNRNYDKGLVVACDSNTNGSVFHVTTYVLFKLPIIKYNLKLKVNNDTKTIYKVYCSDSTVRAVGSTS